MNKTSAIIRPDNSSSTSSDELFPSKVEGVAFCSVLATEAALIVASNWLTLFLFAVTKKLRKRCLFFVFSMACADLMTGALSLPSYIYFYVGNQFRLWDAKVEITWHFFFRNCRRHSVLGFANICSLNIIWEAIRCLSATETQNIVHARLSYRCFYSLDSGCPYFRACKSFILHDFSQTCHLFLDFIHLHAIVYPFRLQHRHLEEGSRAQ